MSRTEGCAVSVAPVATPKDLDLKLTRVIDVPRDRVFAAWTNPKRVAAWWGPHQFTNPLCELDVQAGGLIRIHMRGPNGVLHPMTGVFHEIAAPQRLVFSSRAFEDERGHALLEVLNTVTFAEQNGKTRLTLNAAVVNVEPAAYEALAGMEQGWSESLERLGDYVTCPEDTSLAEREIVCRRMFSAPREIVFDAWTDREQVLRWWGPNGFSTTIQQMDVKPGGVWRFILHGADGRQYRNKIVFLEVEKPGRIFYQHEPEKDTEPVNFRVTVTFTERGGQTLVTLRMFFASAAARELAAKTYGAVDGAQQTLARLENHLAGR